MSDDGPETQLSPRPGSGSAPQPGPVALGPGAEVIPGYTLAHRLGRGGFGEVWRATAPGGVPVAFKFLRTDERSAAVEARALEFMKFVVHPHLLTTFGIWHRDDLLVIGMELADETLLDRLRRAGQPGLPADELWEYMREAAKGIDFLNEPRHAVGGATGVSITHRDIKPQNLLLVGGGVKVADFGLARTLEHSASTKAGAMTPAYAAPEFFDGRFHRNSDQYSLAVTYHQLRTGRLLYAGSPQQVMAGHLSGEPDLTALPDGERDAVARALARRPGDRWASCREFVQRLSDAWKAQPDREWAFADVRIDTRPILGPTGEIASIPNVQPWMPVWVFLGDVYYHISTHVPAYTYGQKWVLREVNTFRVFDVGSPWARSTGAATDDRKLESVGIRAGMTLEVIPVS